jgi:hypothetical protein
MVGGGGGVEDELFTGGVDVLVTGVDVVVPALVELFGFGGLSSPRPKR